MATATGRNIVNDSFCRAVHSMFFCPFVTINFMIKNVYFSPLGKYLQIITTERQQQYLFLPWRRQILFFLFLWHHIRHPWGRGLTHSPWEIRINFQVGRAETKNDSFCLPLKLWSRHLLIFIDADPAQPSFFSRLPHPLFFLAHLLHLQLWIMPADLTPHMSSGPWCETQSVSSITSRVCCPLPAALPTSCGRKPQSPHTRCQNRLSSVETTPKIKWL